MAGAPTVPSPPSHVDSQAPVASIDADLLVTSLSSTAMPDLETPHEDVTPVQVPADSDTAPLLSNHRDEPIPNSVPPEEDDQSSFHASHLSPITAAGAPSVHSEWENNLHSAITACGADSMHTTDHANVAAIPPPPPTTSPQDNSPKQPSTFCGATCQLGCLPLHPEDAKHESLIHAISHFDVDAVA